MGRFPLHAGRITLSVGLWTLGLLSSVASAREADSLWSAVTGGKVDVNLRLRAEFVDQSTASSSQAFTERLRLGYGSQSYQGFSFYLDFEDIRAADYNQYNAAGLNGQPGKAVIADPEDTELNQAYLKYTQDKSQVIFGRQRIILDDARFVGNVGWRQNEQTYDALTLQTQVTEKVTFRYSYLWDINRIFGPSAKLDFTSNSHLINVSTEDPTIGKLVGFAYLLDFGNSAANSSNTFGVRWSRSFDLGEDRSLEGILSYARQTDAGHNPTHYHADYVLAQTTVQQKGLGSLGLGYELLGSDNGTAAFRTPLATLHAKNGWADAFLATPSSGLEDVYLLAGTPLPYEINGSAFYHWFYADQGNTRFGEEFDVVFKKSLSQHIKVLLKFARLNGRASIPDLTKTWLQSEIAF